MNSNICNWSVVTGRHHPGHLEVQLFSQNRHRAPKSEQRKPQIFGSAVVTVVELLVMESVPLQVEAAGRRLHGAARGVRARDQTPAPPAARARRRAQRVRRRQEVSSASSSARAPHRTTTRTLARTRKHPASAVRSNVE